MRNMMRWRAQVLDPKLNYVMSYDLHCFREFCTKHQCQPFAKALLELMCTGNSWWNCMNESRCRHIMYISPAKDQINSQKHARTQTSVQKLIYIYMYSEIVVQKCIYILKWLCIQMSIYIYTPIYIMYIFSYDNANQSKSQRLNIM